MSYVDGFVVPVPAAKKDAYVKMAAAAAPLFKEFGALRHVEAWGDQVPDGALTDFRRAVKAEPGEEIVFSWIEYPSKVVRDAANQKVMSDPRMEALGEDMPFDGQRMIYGGFEVIHEARSDGEAGYIDGALLPAPQSRKADYLKIIETATDVLKEYGARRVVDAWQDDVPHGKVTDFKGAVKASEDEAVVFSWVEWPSKAVRDAAWPKVMADPRMHPAGDPPHDEARRVYGGFEPVLDA